jgi:hypothetical protein
MLHQQHHPRRHGLALVLALACNLALNKASLLLAINQAPSRFKLREKNFFIRLEFSVARQGKPAKVYLRRARTNFVEPVVETR